VRRQQRAFVCSCGKFPAVETTRQGNRFIHRYYYCLCGKKFVTEEKWHHNLFRTIAEKRLAQSDAEEQIHAPK